MKYFWLTIKKMFRFLLKPLSFVPALCVMYMIFSFSAQTADESGQLSMLVSEKVVLLLGKLTSGNLDTAQVGVYADEIHFLVRKMAHFCEYLLLGLTLSLPLYVYRLRGFLLAAGLFCAGFAGLDEYHQMFVAGRSPALRDVAIDTAGSITGIYMTRIIGFIGRKTIFAPLSMEKRRERRKRRAGA